jgi:RNA polymerase sigma-70 factor (ECF subfamily)
VQAAALAWPGAVRARGFGPLVCSIAVGLLGARSDAEDVTQQAFVSAWRSRASFDRRRGHRAGGAVGPGGGQIVLAGELARLPESQRLVMVLAFYPGLTHEKIARVLGCRSAR